MNEKSIHYIFRLELLEEKEEWPEKHQRKRQWVSDSVLQDIRRPFLTTRQKVSFDDALTQVKRPLMVLALEAACNDAQMERINDPARLPNLNLVPNLQ